ncbi:hypothetical protein ACTXT7_015177 [Hymenolepis weldensis]
MAIFLCIINRLLDTAAGRFICSFFLIQWPLWALGYTVQASTFLITEIVNSVCLKDFYSLTTLRGMWILSRNFQLCGITTSPEDCKTNRKDYKTGP